MRAESAAKDLCTQCLERVQTADYERRGKARRDVEHCCGVPDLVRVPNLQNAAERELQRRGGGSVRPQQLPGPGVGGITEWIERNPFKAGAVVGLGLLVLSEG